MAGIPLVNSNSVNDINTSIIAIKKEISSTGNTDVNVTVNLPENSIPVDAVTSGDMHAVTSNAVAEALSYSTSEINTGKKYINGKDIYSRTYDFGYLPNSTIKTMALSINNLEQITKIEGVANKSSGTAIPLPFVNLNNLSYGVSLSVSQNNIEVQTLYNYSEYFARITIEYTKIV